MGAILLMELHIRKMTNTTRGSRPLKFHASTLRYACKDGMALQHSSPSPNFTCSWDGTWTTNPVDDMSCQGETEGERREGAKSFDCRHYRFIWNSNVSLILPANGCVFPPVNVSIQHAQVADWDGKIVPPDTVSSQGED